MNMKKYVTLIFAFLLTACVKHPQVTELDIAKIEESITQIPNKSEERVLDKDNIPNLLLELNPKKIEVKNGEVFITLHSRFGQESGFLWSPRLGNSNISSFTSSGYMPEYIRVKDNLFTFRRR
ncbi:hypothetical protein V6260_09130 [Pseudoalteromonas aliena]|uniref:hypothetical protein n=1 Tax=Pseudoalteromonas aliena TaxID=247523 RepID=UPI00311F2319